MSTVLFAPRANVVRATLLNVSVKETQLALEFAILFTRNVSRIKLQLRFLVNSMSSFSLRIEKMHLTWRLFSEFFICYGTGSFVHVSVVCMMCIEKCWSIEP